MLYITCMHVDLNLLSAFDILLEEGSVAGAAKRMHLSQPAMSRTLGRLRDVTGDQILVRAGRKMTVTPYAQSVRSQVHALIQQSRAVLNPDRDFDLKTLERIFTFRCHDAITTTLGPGLLLELQAKAKGVTLRFLPESNLDTNELRDGEVDLEIGATEPNAADVSYVNVGHDRLVAAFRAGHPLAKGKLTPSRYADALHLTVSRKGRLRDPLDDALKALHLSRRVIASAPSSTAGLFYVSATDATVAVPEKTCDSVLKALSLEIRGIPVAIPEIPIVLAWHRRYDGDKAHTWLRQQVSTILQAILC